MNSRWIILWSICIIIFFVVVFIEPITYENEREGEFPKNSIRLAYSKDIHPSVNFSIITNTDPQIINFRFFTNFFNNTKPGFLAVVLPYEGKLEELGQWKFKEFEENVVLVYEFDCSKENPCTNVNTPHYFDFKLDSKIDQKQSANHSIKFKFGDSAPTEPEYAFIRDFNKNKEHPKLGFRDIDSNVSVMLDKTADRIQTTPESKPDSFSDKNIQRVWKINSEITYQIDYEIPQERQIESNMVNRMAIVGGALAVINLIAFLVSIKTKNSKIPNLKRWLDRDESSKR